MFSVLSRGSMVKPESKIALLPDESHLPQLSADRSYLRILITTNGRMSIPSIKKLAGWGEFRVRRAAKHEWFRIERGEVVLTNEGRG